MSQGKAPKEYLLEEAKRTHKNLFDYSKEEVCKCGHPKTWHRIDGVCLRTERHSSMGAVASCNCERFAKERQNGIKN